MANLPIQQKFNIMDQFFTETVQFIKTDCSILNQFSNLETHFIFAQHQLNTRFFLIPMQTFIQCPELFRWMHVSSQEFDIFLIQTFQLIFLPSTNSALKQFPINF